MTLIKSLQLLLGELHIFIKKDFHALSYLYTFAFISICIFLNYNFGFYQNVIRESYFSGNSLWVIPLFYISIYFATIIPVLIFQKDYKTLRNFRFYSKALFFIVLYGLAIGYYNYSNWEFPSLFSEEKQYVLRLISQLKGCLFFIPSLLMMKYFFDKKVLGLYGLAQNTKHIRAYILLFILMLPFLIFTSFTSDFMRAYPQFRPWLYPDVFSWPNWFSTFVFELTYSLDFVMTELIFRGALVIGMVSILGRKSVLPMVAMYAAIHFGKPLGETISSVFGGYILGALAYQTRHIWGGVIVHICLAITMEVMGFLHFYVFKS